MADKRRGRNKHSHIGEPMEIDSSTSSSGNGYGRARPKPIRKLRADETGASNSESAAESGDQGGSTRRKGKGRFRGLGRAYRAIIAPLSVEIHGKKKQFLPPSNVDPKEVSNYRAPQKRLKLEWVYPLNFTTHTNIPKLVRQKKKKKNSLSQRLRARS